MVNIVEELINRINFLYHKSKNEGLTQIEEKEQKELRDKYISLIKNNFRVQLNTIKRR